MNDQKGKITNLNIYPFRPTDSNQHLLEATFTNGAKKAILISDDPEKIKAMVKIIKVSTPSVFIYTRANSTLFDSISDAGRDF